MTGLPSKPSRGGANKHNNIGSPIVIKSFTPNIADERHSSLEKFINSTSAEEQLGILKIIIKEQKDLIVDEVIQFLAIVFYEAAAKHPVKCFLSRHVTKCSAIQKSFTSFLTTHIVSEIKRIVDYGEYVCYSEIVPKVMMCTENFPCGALAVEAVGADLLIRCLFLNYFTYCRKEFRESTLSPTKKNEMFNLEHIMLRLIVHVIQKLHINESDHGCNSEGYVKSIRVTDIQYCVYILICDEDVPMDTKSLSGILFLSTENLMVNCEEAWKLLLEASIGRSNPADPIKNGTYDLVLRHKLGRLAIYTAIATTVPMGQLQKPLFIHGSQTPAILMLLDQLLSYVDGSSSEPAVTVAVTRALLQLSRSLDHVECDELGGRAAAALLPFVWTHLEFHLDSVCHLANQILAACLEYCARLEKRDVTAPLQSVLQSVRALGEARGFYWAASRAAPALGAARVLTDLCDAPRLLRAAATPHLQAAASSAILALLSGGACAGLETEEVFDRWVRPALGSPAALQAVLPATIAAHPALTEYIGSNVHGRAALACARAAPACGARLTPRALRAAAIHAQDEVRLLALSLVCERGELAAALWLLRHNLNAPRPGFRTALRANVNKVLKRVAERQRRGAGARGADLSVRRLRALCLDAALRGASLARRSAALQLLADSLVLLPDFTMSWEAEHVETLLLHLDDSYDTNKETALQILQHCPLELLEECTRALSLESVLRSAESQRPARAAAAPVKLQLLLTRLPHRVAPLPPDTYLVQQEALRPHYALAHALWRRLRALRAAPGPGPAEPGPGPAAPGLLRCLAALLRRPELSAVEWRRAPWAALRAGLEAESLRACAAAEPVVTCPAPEGHLPGDTRSETDEEELQPVTAQMVLVCAWRAVKEAADVLGLVARGDRAGQYLVGLLTRATHRGAVEQAAAGLAAVARACWVDSARAHLPVRWARELLARAGGEAPRAERRGAGLPAAIQALVSSEVSATGRAECFNECMTALLRLASAATGDPADVARRTLAANILRALFRHAALEKVSQAYVGAGLRLALCGFEAAAWPERTAMSLLFCALCVRVFGVVRARGAALHARNTLPAPLCFARYPGIYDLMMSKLQEFEPRSGAGPAVLPVLLLLARLRPAAPGGAASSLKAWSFVPPVQRCAGASELRVRRAAARALPALLPTTQHLSYIERLLSAISRSDLLHNEWHGALLTLASLLERAPPGGPPASPGGPPAPPGGPPVPPASLVSGSLAALTQALGPRPCYVVAREYVNVLNLIIWKFPGMVASETLECVREHLHAMLFPAAPPAAGPDLELCLADCALLYFIILYKQKRENLILPQITRALRHTRYEVVLSALDCLLTQRSTLPDTHTCNLRTHLLAISDVTIHTNHRQTDEYATMITELSKLVHDTKTYQECRLKSLKLLSLEDDTQMLIINEVLPSHIDDSNEWLAEKLINRIENSHNDVKPMFLESLIRLTKDKHEQLNRACLLNVYRTMYDCCSADNSCESRMAVVGFYESCSGWEKDTREFQPSEKFTFEALVLSTLVTLLEDDDDVIRQRAADVTTRAFCPLVADDGDAASEDLSLVDVTLEDETSLRLISLAARDNGREGVVPSAAGRGLRARAGRGLRAREGRRGPALLLLALLDFRAEVCLTDEVTSECRVFDQSERYNMFLEESVWTASCADAIIQITKEKPQEKHTNLIDYALSIIRDQEYSFAFNMLCNENVKLFEKMAKGDFVADETVNPKIEILVKKLRGK